MPRPLLNAVVRYRFALILLLQSAIICGSLTAAYLLRFDGAIPASEWPAFQKGLVVALILKLAAFRLGRLDHGWSRFVGIRDVYNVLLVNLLGTLLFTAVNLAFVGATFPRSVYLIDLLVCFLVTAATRCAARIYQEVAEGGPRKSAGRRVLIYGAGAAGVALLQEIHNNPRLGYRVAGFLDDDPAKWRTALLGVTVHGPGRSAAQICARFLRRRVRIEEIVIAMPSATGKQMSEALANCRAAGVPCKTVPSVGELLSGKFNASQIREVSVVDLLGRAPVHLDETVIRRSIAGRSILVTGAAGSIGSELCRQIGRFGPRHLVLFDVAESPLFYIDNQMRAMFPALKVHASIGDIRDVRRLEDVLREYAVESVFHAAAYKHVPLMENHVFEAVRNNVLGTRNVVLAAERCKVTDFLMISSDKAVNPANVMGATKRAAELIVSSWTGAGTAHAKRVSVRFGNVLGSNGSVVPLFREQILNGGPVTVTHPDMRRFFMTIPEAVQLVLQASTMGKGSEVFVLDMGEAVKIVDLARNMIRLSGHEPDVDIEVRFTGLRPGEKLFEELSIEGENIRSTYHEKIKIFSGARLKSKQVEAWLETLETLVANRDEAALIEHIQELVPEYRPSAGVRPAPAALSMSATAGD